MAEVVLENQIESDDGLLHHEQRVHLDPFCVHVPGYLISVVIIN